DLLPARLDDFAPTALEERSGAVRAFFATASQRDAAQEALSQHQTRALDVPDDDWAVRSQQNLTPVIVGRIRVVPDAAWLRSGEARDAAALLDIVIEPSMGFGTGHHATTRLCLAALQAEEVNGKSVVDVGTGSGILAIAAAKLGAGPVHGLDYDADAIQNAVDNQRLNPGGKAAAFAVADLAVDEPPTADLVLANLTGAQLVKSAGRLSAA